MSGIYSLPGLSASVVHDPKIKVEAAINAKFAIALNLIFICLYQFMLSD